MPQYVKTVWVNGTVPALNDSNLNKIEQGIFDAFRQDGSTTMSGQLVTTAGSAATPAIAPTGDANTGIFFPAADTIAFGEGGAEAMRINSSGQILINTTNTDSKVVIQSNDAQIMAFGNGNANAAELILRSNSLSDPRGSLSVFGSASTINYQGLQPSTMALYSTADIAINAESTKHIRFHTGTEKMRITSAGNVGIGTTSPSYKTEIHGSDTGFNPLLVINNTNNGVSGNYSYLQLQSNNGTNKLNIGIYNTDAGKHAFINNAASGDIKFEIGTGAGIEKMRITSAGNVGIGTTTPNTTLQVDDTYGGYRAGIIVKNTADGATGRGTGIEWHSGTGTTKGEISLTAIDANRDGYDMKFLTTATGGSKTTKMTITGAGHVGIGTTPSTWGSGYTALSIKNAGNSISSSGASQLLLSSNAYDSGAGAWKYTDNGYFANLMEIGSNGYLFYTTQSTQGAGNPITWSERMRITSAGNVGIGTTSPDTLLHIKHSSQPTITFEDSSANKGYLDFNSTRMQMHGGSGSIYFVAGSSEKMRLTSAGNVGIGITTPQSILHVADMGLFSKYNNGPNELNGAYIGNDGTYPTLDMRRWTGVSTNHGTAKIRTLDTADMCFYVDQKSTNTTATSERMRLTAAGYLLIGYTSSNGAYPLQVNGQIFATSSTIATSDGRYKKDVVALDGALDIVKALNPVQFSWKDHPVHKFNTDVPTVGFLAQEVEQALADKSYLTSIIKKSECTWETETGETIEREVTRDVEKQVTREVEREITETIDGEEVTRTITEEVTETIIEQVTEIVIEPVKETHTEEFLGIAESNLIAILTKAVKELNAKVEALEAQLNGN